MSASILVIEYEPRYVEHVRKALAGPAFHLEIAGNMDDAVNRCASFEPAVVIITSVLPNLKIEDAITQLRARGGEDPCRSPETGGIGSGARCRRKGRAAAPHG